MPVAVSRDRNGDSSTTSGQIEWESAPFGSAGRDESNGIRLEVGARLSLSAGVITVIAPQPTVRQTREIL